MEPPLWSVKYSPQSWDDFIGQDSAIRQLQNLAEAGSCPNMILHGPYGTGKTSAALVFSRVFLDDAFTSNFKMLSVRDVAGYPVSKAKRDIKALAKLDRSKRTELDEYMSFVFKEVKSDLKAKGRSRNPNRSQLLQGAIRLFASTITVSDEKVKVLVLDEADALTGSMQQALRRTMEIYSDVCRFIFTTPTLAGWSPAVISRSLSINFPSPSEDAIVALVRSIAQKESVEIDSAALKAVARESGGDLRFAVNLLQIAAADGKPVTESIVYERSETEFVKEVRKMVDLAIAGAFVDSRNVLRRLLGVQNYSPQEVCLAIQRNLVDRHFELSVLKTLLERVAEIDHRLIQAQNPFIQITALLASIGRISSEAT
ncbi:MAG: AAA family ATPase [Candidatus Thorarchaeota archaeon]|jgi:replication factor C small subunit